MKLSKKLLALGLSIGLVISSTVPAFAAGVNGVTDALPGLDDVFNSIEHKTYTAEEKAKIMNDAENIVDAWDDVVYADNVLKLKDSQGQYYLVSIGGTVDADGTLIVENPTSVGGFQFKTVNGVTVVPSRNGMPLITAEQYMNGKFLEQFHRTTGATNKLSDYKDKMYSDFEYLFHELHFDALGQDDKFKIYENENTNISDIGDTLLEVSVFDLLDVWTYEGSLLDGLNDALSRAPLTKAKTTDNGSTNGASVNTSTATNKSNTTTTTTTTTTKTAPEAASVVKPATGQGLPLANTATNYGNVMALGLGAMVVALGVFAYSKKVTA